MEKAFSISRFHDLPISRSPVFSLRSLHRHLQPRGFQYRVERRKSRIPAGGKRPVQAFSRHPGRLRHFGHPLRLGYRSQRGEIHARIAVLGSSVQVFRRKRGVRSQFLDEPLTVRHAQFPGRRAPLFRLTYCCHRYRIRYTRTTAAAIRRSMSRCSLTSRFGRPCTPETARMSRTGGLPH
jgi:hypothetical protein